eukprot:TRINITY_DN176_c0_g1_i1.p1 TRINITY_DN176_c0_g1~~TRINITY_DN176_c0_g1_i1.p1  ORF type:complete len:448 (-),score=155.44 TRINITY_DN176_c0_g1_i1:94-1437(-)
MSKFVRTSKYRHVFGKQPKVDECYSEIRVTRSAWDTNKIAANTKFFAACWEAGGGGAFIVKDFKETGKGSPSPPLVAGHKADVLDLDWNPFNEHLIASCSEDCLVKIWSIPEEGVKKTMTEPVQTLKGHGRKAGTVHFHPVANNILASTSTDFTIKLWDIEKGENIATLPGHSDIIDSAAWNLNGSLFATTCKDKKIRIFDPRSGKITAEAIGHEGVKGSRIVWTGRRNEIFTVGFSKQSDRQYALRDPANLSKVKAAANIDTASGKLMAFYDNDIDIIYLAGKGDGNIRYYEVTDQEETIYFLSAYKSSIPQKGMCMVPKRVMNLSECEVTRLLKVNDKNFVEPISFYVPRKSDVFHGDIYPPAYKGVPALSAAEWFGGKDAEPVTFSLEAGYVAPPAVEFKPVIKEEKELSSDELKSEVDKLKSRVAYLEAELIKRDAKIAELSA